MERKVLPFPLVIHVDIPMCKESRSYYTSRGVNE